MGMKEHLQERTGIYKLGFDFWSFVGISLPFIIVIFGGAALAFWVTR